MLSNTHARTTARRSLETRSNEIDKCTQIWHGLPRAVTAICPEGHLQIRTECLCVGERTAGLSVERLLECTWTR